MLSHRHRGQRGQIIVLFALALVAMVAMVGLILDGGSAFAQRRSEQNASDLAALAAANDLIVNQGSANWLATARSVAAQNGYTDGVGGVTVEVTCKNCPGQTLDPAYDGVQVTVHISAPHPNSFASIVGMTSWDVGATATSKTGWPDTSIGPGPFIVSQDVFDSTGKAKTCADEDHVCTLSHPVNDTPTVATDFTWTDFSYDKLCEDTGNVNDNDLQNYMDGRANFSLTLTFGCYIAQHNDGVMNNIVDRLQALAPITFPIPVVDASGAFVGWASFHLTAADPGGRNGEITGWFETTCVDNHCAAFQNQQLDVKSPGFGTPTFNGTYVLKLVN